MPTSSADPSVAPTYVVTFTSLDGETEVYSHLSPDAVALALGLVKDWAQIQSISIEKINH